MVSVALKDPELTVFESNPPKSFVAHSVNGSVYLCIGGAEPHSLVLYPFISLFINNHFSHSCNKYLADASYVQSVLGDTEKIHRVILPLGLVQNINTCKIHKT